MNLGIVQGRLSVASNGELQWFPQDNWETEFVTAAKIGLENIELIAERKLNDKNPIWSESGVNRLMELSAENGVNINTLCNDYIIDHSLVESPEVLNQNLNLVNRGMKLKCNKYVLPFLRIQKLI